MKQPIRYFSIGLLTSSIILLIGFTLTNDKSETLEDLSIEEMIAVVQEDGYRVLSESDYITLAVNGDQDSDDETKDKPKNEDDKQEKSKDKKENENKEEDKEDEEDKDEDGEEEIFKYTVHVKANMLAPDISKLLKENKIIEDASKFSKYLEDEGYSKYIQLGKHKVSSDMSTKEIAEELTKY